MLALSNRTTHYDNYATPPIMSSITQYQPPQYAITVNISKSSLHHIYKVTLNSEFKYHTGLNQSESDRLYIVIMKQNNLKTILKKPKYFIQTVSTNLEVLVEQL